MSRQGPIIGLWLYIAANAEVILELGHGASFPFKCLLQERPFLIRTKRRGLTIQRSDGAISTHVFPDTLPAHKLSPFAVVLRLCRMRFSKSLAGLADNSNGYCWPKDINSLSVPAKPKHGSRPSQAARARSAPSTRSADRSLRFSCMLSGHSRSCFALAAVQN
jgi:hypothetical protein